MKKVLCCIACFVLLANLAGCTYHNSFYDVPKVEAPEGTVQCLRHLFDEETDTWYYCTAYTDAEDRCTYDELVETWKISSWKVGNSYSGEVYGTFSSGLVFYGGGYVTGSLDKKTELTFWQVRDDGGTELKKITVPEYATLIHFEEEENLRIEKHIIYHNYWLCKNGHEVFTQQDVEYRIYTPQNSMVMN